MERQTKRNIALDFQVLHSILLNLDESSMDSRTSDHQLRWLTMVGGFLQISFGPSMRGNEVTTVETGGLINNLPHGTDASETVPFVVIPLLGRFKNEDGEQCHLMLSASVTRSGFKVKQWLTRIVSIIEVEGKKSGPAFCHPSKLIRK